MLCWRLVDGHIGGSRCGAEQTTASGDNRSRKGMTRSRGLVAASGRGLPDGEGQEEESRNQTLSSSPVPQWPDGRALMPGRWINILERSVPMRAGLNNNIQLAKRVLADQAIM